MTDLSGQVVLISGAGRGAGRDLARAFAGQGAAVALNDIAPLNIDPVVTEIIAAGGRAKAYVEDVAKKVGVQAVVNGVQDDWGRIDALVHHAAVSPREPVLDLDEWDWHRTLDVALTGAFLLTQSVGRLMRTQGGGVIVHLVSLSPADPAAYAAAQAGLAGFTRQAAPELLRDGIRLHAVCRGLPELARADPGCPADLVQAVLYLCGPQAAGLSGQIVNLP